MRHYVYMVVNLINGKIYVGKHSTAKTIERDDYMGSGVLIKRALAVHGAKNFAKTIIKECTSERAALMLEKQIVDDAFVARADTYNLTTGGDGSWSHIEHESRKDEYQLRAKHMNDIHWNTPGAKERHSARVAERNKRLHKEGKLRAPDWTGRKHKESTKRKIGKAAAEHQQGVKNSNYGNVWIYSLADKCSKLVPKTELDSWLNKGWIKGRKIKFMR